MEFRCTVIAKGPVVMGKAPAIVSGELDSAMYEATMFLEAKVKKIIEQEGRMGVGGSEAGLYKSVASEVIDKGTPVVKGIVFSGKPYSDVIEKGRRPGKAWPPAGVLLQWIQLKLGLSGKPAKEAEFLIRRKIGEKGFPGIHMFERAWTENLGQLQAIFERAGYRIVGRLEESAS